MLNQVQSNFQAKEQRIKFRLRLVYAALFTLVVLLFSSALGVCTCDSAMAAITPEQQPEGRAATQPAITRLASSDAQGTSVDIAKQTFSAANAKSDWVLIARDDDFADAMSATGLAGTLQAPIILANRNETGLSTEALEEIKALGAKNAYIIGGTGAIPFDIESQLKELGIDTKEGTEEGIRVAGTDYFDTSVACYEKIKEHLGEGEEISEAIIAFGQNFQDALSISSYAYAYKVPIFLQQPGESAQDRTLSQEEVKCIEEIVGTKAAPKGTIYVPGGTGAVSKESAEDEFEALASNFVRLEGYDGYKTSNVIAKYFTSEEGGNKLSASTVVIANGAEAPKGTDALAGSALAGQAKGVILLTNMFENYGTISTSTLIGWGTSHEDLTTQTGFLQDRAKEVSQTFILGGESVIESTTVEMVKLITWRWYLVTFDANGGSEVAAQNVFRGDCATEPKPSPTKEGFGFAGWYEQDLTTPFTFAESTIGADTTVWAKWNENVKTITASQVSLSADTFQYTGSAPNLSVKVVDPDTGSELVQDSDYELVYSEDIINAGDASVTVLGKGNYTGKVVKSFKILQATPTPTTADKTALAGLTALVGDNLGSVLPSLPASYGGVEGSFAFTSDEAGNPVSESTVISQTPATTTFNATFTPTDTRNFATVENVQVTITVSARPNGAYWLATVPSDSAKVSEAECKAASEADATGGTMYKSAEAVKADIEKMQTELADGYQAASDTTSALYKSYMTSDKVHLYTTYGSSDADWTDGSSAVQAANKYAEFRIIEVGSHQHGANSTDVDGSVLTFQATHLLPEAYRMNNTTDTNAGGWEVSSLRALFQPAASATSAAGSIYSKFNASFTDDIKQTTKTSNTGSQGSAVKTTTDKFFLLSYSEIAGGSSATGAYTTLAPALNTEGVAYSYFAAKTIAREGNNTALVRSTRAGYNPQGSLLTSNFWWLRSPYTNSANSFLTVSNTGAIAQAGYNANAMFGVAPAFCMGSVGTSSSTKVTVSFNNNSHGLTPASKMVDAGSSVTAPTAEEYGTQAGLKLEGWYTDQYCRGNKFDFSSKVLRDTQLYANWVIDSTASATDNAYWIGFSSKKTLGNTGDQVNKTTPAYVSEEWNVKRTAAEIREDVKKIQAGDSATANLYKEWIDCECYHLYTKWDASSTESASLESADKYVEFRILQVGNHDNDTAAITFQATHELPLAASMNTLGSNNGGWAASALRQSLQENGTIYGKFNEAFTSDIAKVSKKTTQGNTGTTTTTSTDKFWVPSLTEVFGEVDETLAPNEGSQHAYFQDKSLSTTASNPALSRGLRSSSITAPANANGASQNWWVRTASLADSTSYFSVDGSGNALAGAIETDKAYGVVPAFAFGADANENNSAAVAKLSDTSEVGASTNSEEAAALASTANTKGEVLSTSQAAETAAQQGTTFPVYTLKKNVDDDQAMVLLIMGDGFTAAEQSTFLDAARTRAEVLLKMEPYRNYANNINVYAMCVASNESGVTSYNNIKDTYLGIKEPGYTFRTDVLTGASETFEQRAINLRSEVEQNILTSSNSNFVPWVSTTAIISNTNEPNQVESYGFASSLPSSGFSVSAMSTETQVKPCCTYYVGTTFVQQVTKTLAKLDNESYATTNGHNTDVVANCNASSVKWNKFVGYSGIGYWASGSTVAPTNGYCLLYDTKNIGYLFGAPALNANPICSVCEEEIASAISRCNNVAANRDLWVSHPEITVEHSDNISMLNTFDNYRIQYFKYKSGADIYTTNDLPSKGAGKEVEFRTVVQNLNTAKERKLKLVLATYDANNNVKETKAESFVVPAAGANDAATAIKDRESCMSLSLKMTLANTYADTDIITGQLIDEETGSVLATNHDLYLAQTNFEVKFRYVDKDTGAEIDTAKTSVMNLPAKSTLQVTHPSGIPGYKYDGCSTDTVTTGYANIGDVGPSQTVTYYFTKSNEPACAHTSTKTVKAQEPTCAVAGLEKTVCSSCSKTLSTQEIACLGHDFNANGVCIRCSTEDAALKEKPASSAQNAQEQVTLAASTNSANTSFAQATSSQGTTFPVHTIKKNVDDDEALVIVLMGDGFTSTQQGKFLEAAKVRAEALLRVEPYRSYANNINIYAMEVVSNEEGVSQTGFLVDTYLGVLQYNDRDAKFRNSQEDGSSDESGNSIYEARARSLKEEVEANVLTSSTSSFKPSVNYVHIISNKDYYFGQSQNYGTYSFSSLSDSSFPTGSTFVHELSHSVGTLGDEYSYAIGRNHNVDTLGKTNENVKWAKLIGFQGTYIFRGTEVGTGVASAIVPQNYCIMKNNGNYTYWWEYPTPAGVDAFCEACKLEIAKKLMKCNRVANSTSLYVALPEITIEHNSDYQGLYLYDQNYRVRDYEYASGGETYKFNDLAQKANGKEVEFRTVVQNVDTEHGRNVKVRLTTFEADGKTVKQTAESAVVPVGHAGVYTYEVTDAYGNVKTEQRDDFLSYTYERQSCQSVSVKMTLTNDYTDANTILGEVIDADTNKVLSTDKDLFNCRGNSNLNIRYVDAETNTEIENTGGGKIPMKQNSTYNVTHPSSVNGYTYVGNSATNNTVTTGALENGAQSSPQTLTYYFKKVDQSTCAHTKTYVKTTTKPTCTQTGTGETICSECGKNLNEPVTIKALGHSYVSQASANPACTSAGHSAFEKCSVCGDEQGKTTTPALGHDFSAQGKCTRCGVDDEALLEKPVLQMQTFCKVSGNSSALFMRPHAAEHA